MPENRKFFVATRDGVKEAQCHPDLRLAIIWEFPDGTVSIRPADPMTRLPGENEEQQVQRLIGLGKRGAVRHSVCDFWSLPMDTTFRAAWVADGSRVAVDMAKARAIQRDYLRSLRGRRFAALDVEYMRADESGNVVGKARVAAAKAALRDVTKDPSLEAAGTADELKAVVPAVLREST